MEVARTWGQSSAQDPDCAVVVALTARLPSSRTWRACPRSTRRTDSGRQRWGRGAWPAPPALIALYGFVAVLAPGGWDGPPVVLGTEFAALAGYVRLDPAKTRPVPPPPASRGGDQEAARCPRGVGRSVADAERALAVERIPKEKRAATLAGEGTSIFELSEAQVLYEKAAGWSLVSHTFEGQTDGSAVLSLMFERTERSFRLGRWWHHVVGG